MISTSSLIIGVAAAAASRDAILTAGFAGLVAGSMSMAAGEYVSVSSQADAENADMARERVELAQDPEAELDELTQIYVERGAETATAKQVARQLMAHDALGAHARDELGIVEMTAARPLQAAYASAIAFASGAAAPLAIALFARPSWILVSVATGSIAYLGILGGLGAAAGQASRRRGALRVVIWGVLAMAVTAGIGRLFGTPV